ncbi:heterokaryon incompatibility [Lasiodiplodia theobromae]|nr:heterokaryon incompatibility [Lasiodiplodia theobromae]
MWIDQICIDQSNQREKELQIPLMSKIYRYAINTVVWLGEASEGSDNAVELLKFIGTAFQLTVDAPAPEDFERLLLPSPQDPLWKHLWDLSNRAWFNRLWIVQECILSDNLWVMCGSTTIIWEELTNGFANLIQSELANWLQSEHGTAAPDGQTTGWEAVYVLSEERVHYHQAWRSISLSLFNVLARTRNTQASDPRDKIYGLLGICHAPGIEVNYDPSNTMADVYHAATLTYLRGDTEHLLPNLCCVDHDESSSAGLLPSWVPDWSRSQQTSPLGFSTSSGAIYHAGGINAKASFSTRGPGDRELLVPGKTFDAIARVSDVCTTPDIFCDDPQSANAHFLPWIELAQQQCAGHHHPYPSGLFDAFWHTLVAGADGEGIRKSPASAFAEIFSLLLDATTGQEPTFPDQTYSARQRRPRGSKGRLELANLRGRRAPGRTYQEVRHALRRAVRNRRLCMTEKGRGQGIGCVCWWGAMCLLL